MKHKVYVGTYSPADAKSIAVLQFDDDTGALTTTRAGATGIASPSYLALHPNNKWLYAVSEAGGGEIWAFTRNPRTGALTAINRQSARGGGPCHLSLDAKGRSLLAANYGGGSVISFPLDSASGGVGAAGSFIQHVGSSVNTSRQKEPHGHCILPAPNGAPFAVACDLGLDKVLVYRYDAAHGTLAAHEPSGWKADPGSGPRHAAWHPNGKFLFVIHELNSTMTALKWDGKKGILTEINTLPTLPASHSGFNAPAAVRVHPTGRFVYGSNRGHDSIAAFRVDERTGRIKLSGVEPIGGKNPRDFNLDPSGRWLLAGRQDNNTIGVFRVNERTGLLSPTGKSARVAKPVCIVFAD